MRTFRTIVRSRVFPTDIPKPRRIQTPLFDVVFDKVIIDEDVNIPGDASILDLECVSDVHYRLLSDHVNRQMWKSHNATDKTVHENVVINFVFVLSAQVRVFQLPKFRNMLCEKRK